MSDLTGHAQSLVDSIAYVTVGTINDDGTPWTSPVYFTADGLRDFYWTSSLESLHSRNIAARSAVSLVVFDSTVPAYYGRALYVSAVAEFVADDDLPRGLELYPGPEQRGGSQLTFDDVSGSSPYRLYRARASEVWVLCPREPRQPCPLHGLDKDHRARVA